jgi:RNA 3'-terminal phosphate cyclase
MGAVGLVGMLLTSRGSASYSSSGVQSAITSSSPIRGIIAGETSLPIAAIGASLQEALVPTNGYLARIETNTRGRGPQGSGSVNVNISGLAAGSAFETQIRRIIEGYFMDYLAKGAR